MGSEMCIRDSMESVGAEPSPEVEVTVTDELITWFPLLSLATA